MLLSYLEIRLYNGFHKKLLKGWPETRSPALVITAVAVLALDPLGCEALGQRPGVVALGEPP